jgi:hypothetical protein
MNPFQIAPDHNKKGLYPLPAARQLQHSVLSAILQQEPSKGEK